MFVPNTVRPHLHTCSDDDLMITCLEACTACALAFVVVCCLRFEAHSLWSWPLLLPCGFIPASYPDAVSCSHTSHTPALCHPPVVFCTTTCGHSFAGAHNPQVTTDCCTAVSEPGERRCGAECVAPALHVSRSFPLGVVYCGREGAFAFVLWVLSSLW